MINAIVASVSMAFFVTFFFCNSAQGNIPPGPVDQQTARPQIPDGHIKLAGCNCLPIAVCPNGYGQLGVACIPETEGPGICCVPQEGVVLNNVSFTKDGYTPKTPSSKTVVKAFEDGKELLKTIKDKKKERLSNGMFLNKGTPERGHAYFFQRSPEAVERHEEAYLIALTSQQLATSESLTPQQSFYGLPEIQPVTYLPNFQCPTQVIPVCNASAKYRTITGVCNNLLHPNYGVSSTKLRRLSLPLYNDGIVEPRVYGVNGFPLPGPREATNNILIDINLPDFDHTLTVMQWSQFMDHDLSLVPFPDMNGQAIMCCKNGQLVQPQPEHCFPIILPVDDPFYAPRGQGCINFVRSMLALKENCTLGPVEQVNTLTHFVDGSMIYGSNQATFEKVVNRTTGFMKTSNGNLPPINASIDCAAPIPGTACFVGGDSRINEQPALTVMHTIWIREHNRIAAALRVLHPGWDANTLFQETRRIVIAEVQHITYTEWLPIIIGPTMMARFGLVLPPTGYRNGYDPTVNPGINNEFAAACFRYGHSLLQGIFRIISATGQISSIRLRDVFNNPKILTDNPALVDDYTRALITEEQQSFDRFITKDVTNHLFQTPQFDFGMDLMSLNIQRGRDHAIATYNQMRPFGGFPTAYNFLSLSDTHTEFAIRRIQTVYRNVDDIDLFVGSVSEKHLPDALLGPTMAAVVGIQFRALLKGDRFFYDLAGQPGSFTLGQLQEIRKVSMAKIFCDNTNIISVQPSAFQKANLVNYRRNCGNIIGMDLTQF